MYRKVSLPLLLLFLFLTVACNTFLQKEIYDYFLYSLATVSFVAGFFTYRIFKGSVNGRIILLYSLAYLLWALGEYVWEYYEMQGLEPFPSFADFFYLIAYIPAILGLLIANRSFGVVWKEKGKVLLTSIALTIIIFAPFAPTVSEIVEEEMDFVEKSLLLAYPALDLPLIFLAIPIFLSFRKSKFALGWLLITLGVFLGAIGDLLFMHHEWLEIYEAASLPDIAFALDYLATCIGFLSLRRK